MILGAKGGSSEPPELPPGSAPDSSLVLPVFHCCMLKNGSLISRSTLAINSSTCNIDGKTGSGLDGDKAAKRHFSVQ